MSRKRRSQPALARRLVHPWNRLDLGIHASVHFCGTYTEVAINTNLGCASKIYSSKAINMNFGTIEAKARVYLFRTLRNRDVVIRHSGREPTWMY